MTLQSLEHTIWKTIHQHSFNSQPVQNILEKMKMLISQVDVVTSFTLTTSLFIYIQSKQKNPIFSEEYLLFSHFSCD